MPEAIIFPFTKREAAESLSKPDPDSGDDPHHHHLPGVVENTTEQGSQPAEGANRQGNQTARGSQSGRALGTARQAESLDWAALRAASRGRCCQRRA